MSDFRRGAPPPHMMRPIVPTPAHMMAQQQNPIKHNNMAAAPIPIMTNLCPEFLKGECVQFQCPKNHPEASLLFCQAYQRDMCQNSQSCNYMHATIEEEQYYKETGLIPLRFMHQSIRMERGKGPLPNGQPPLFPVETTTKVETFTPATTETPAPAPYKQETPPDKHKMEQSPEPGNFQKRQKISYEELETEANMLREKVRVLEKKIEQLDNTNELLLEKNAKLRSSSKRSPDRRRSRSADKRDDRARRHGRDRSRERNRSREGRNKDDNFRGSGGGGRWNNDFNNNYNRGPMNQM